MPQTPLDQSDAQLVAEACGRAAQVLGLSPQELSEVLSQHQPSAEGQLALLFLRIYRSLHGFDNLVALSIVTHVRIACTVHS